MLMKEPRANSYSKKGSFLGLKTFLFGELVLFGFCYYQWRKMNRSQDHRYMMYQKNPRVLKAFYWSADKMGFEGIKDADYKAWGVHFNKKVEKLY